ncbi:hypothetical protein ACJIZ3_000024 [Penstemon smallii]|uniref:Uncharacterized protein n=1 Tax=Penstemon smallii TaxID=265156 RepID=A0ABD3RBJ8_9LAMI
MTRFSSVLIRSIPRRCVVESNRKQIPWLISQYHSAEKSYLIMNQHQWNRSAFGNTFSSYNKQQYANFSSLSNADGDKTDHKNINQSIKVEIISKEYIKPASPTPDHMRMYEVSALDQLYPHFYMPFVYFYQNNHEDDGSELINHCDLILKRRQLLKHSLAETLSRFYPLAGVVKGSRLIDCNDEGVYYVEAKVSGPLAEFLNQPDNKSIHRFLPIDPNSMELLFSKTYVAMIQVTVFGCGGIAIGLCTSHKIIDGFSHTTFLKAWAATAAHECSSEKMICPSFISPSIFPPNPTLPENASMMSSSVLKLKKCATRRFLFGSSSIIALKKKAAVSTRVMAIIGLIWKCAVAASKDQAKASNSIQRSSVMIIPVNLREKSTPPMPPYAIGNIFWTTDPIQYGSDEDDLELDSIVGRLKNAINKIDSDFIEKLKGEEWSLKVGERLNEMHKQYSNENANLFMASSMCNSGIYETTFGWGKLLWASVGNADADIPIVCNLITLIDTKSGNGVEAWVTLSEQDMAFLEKDPELLAFASVDPCPLQIVD